MFLGELWNIKYVYLEDSPLERDGIFSLLLRDKNIYCHLFMVSLIFFLIRLRQHSARNEVHSLSLCCNSCISRPADPFSSSEFFSLVNLGTAIPLTQCEFELQAASLLSDQLAYIIFHLTKRAEAWAPPKYCLRSSTCILLWQFTTSSSTTSMG